MTGQSCPISCTLRPVLLPLALACVPRQSGGNTAARAKNPTRTRLMWSEMFRGTFLRGVIYHRPQFVLYIRIFCLDLASAYQFVKCEGKVGRRPSAAAGKEWLFNRRRFRVNTRGTREEISLVSTMWFDARRPLWWQLFGLKLILDKSVVYSSGWFRWRISAPASVTLLRNGPVTSSPAHSLTRPYTKTSSPVHKYSPDKHRLAARRSEPGRSLFWCKTFSGKFPPNCLVYFPGLRLKAFPRRWLTSWTGRERDQETLWPPQKGWTNSCEIGEEKNITGFSWSLLNHTRRRSGHSRDRERLGSEFRILFQSDQNNPQDCVFLWILCLCRVARWVMTHESNERLWK